MLFPTWSSVRPWLLAAAAVPVMFSVSLSIDDVPEAQGCGGSGPFGSGLLSATIEEIAGAGAPIPVDLTGFFVVTLQVRGAGPDLAIAGVSVSVEDSQGNAIDGSLSELDRRPGYPDLDIVTMGWSATSALAPGDYHVELVGAPSSTTTTSARLTAVEQTIAPSTLPIESTSLTRFTDDVGELLSCQVMPNCGPSTFSFGADTETFTSLDVELTHEMPVAIAWEVTIQGVDGKGTLEAERTSSQLMVRPFDSVDKTWLTTATFSGDFDEYCFDVVLRDLRTEAEAKTRVCRENDADALVSSIDGIATCGAPPTPELAERWCGVHPESTLEACQPDPATQDPSYVPEPAGEPTPTPEPVDTAQADRTSEACSIGRGLAGNGLLLGVAAFGLLGVLRRRRPQQR
jgi:hypothetical protein